MSGKKNEENDKNLVDKKDCECIIGNRIYNQKDFKYRFSIIE